MTTVYVWLPTFRLPKATIPTSSAELTRKALSTIEHTGHAALLLSDSTYISWWPDQHVDSNQRSPGFSARTLDSDLQLEEPLSVKEDVSGLHEDVMSSWWRGVSEKGFAIPYTFENNPKTTHFDLWQTNCSNIVAIALRLGGAESICPLPRFDMMTPIHIATWTKAAAFIQAAQGLGSKKISKL